MRLAVAGRDERPRSSACVWAWVEGYGNRGWLKPPTPEEGLLDVNHRRGRKKRISRKDAKTPREEGEGGK